MPVCILVLPIGHVLIIAHVTRGAFLCIPGVQTQNKKQFWVPCTHGSTQGLSSIYVDQTISYELLMTHVTRYIISPIDQ